jgi:hypothetical protein
MSFPYCCSAAGEMISPSDPENCDCVNTTGKSPSGAVSTNSTVSGSTARMDAICFA